MTSQITALPLNERLIAILWSSSSIPLQLLYNSEQRLRPDEDHRERWLPLTPKGSNLTHGRSLQFIGDGEGLQLMNWNIEEPLTAVMMKTQAVPRYCFVLDSNAHKIYFVEAIRSKCDELSPRRFQAVCIIIDRPVITDQTKEASRETTIEPLDEDPEVPGACFYVALSTERASASVIERRENFS